LPAALRLPWSGTFHAIGNRLIRLHAERLGLDPGFNVLDRTDAADLMDVVRQRLGLSKTEKRFPRKDTCLAIYSHRVNAQLPLRRTLELLFPWCLEWEDALTALCREYVDSKLAQQLLDYDDLLLYWQLMMAEPTSRPESGRASTMCSSTSTRTRTVCRPGSCGAEARWRGRHGRRRRRAGDLLFPRGDGREHPRVS
jgi:DNA helicase-2/ATP-dependent DNA helicase PcrA